MDENEITQDLYAQAEAAQAASTQTAPAQAETAQATPVQTEAVQAGTTSAETVQVVKKKKKWVVPVIIGAIVAAIVAIIAAVIVAAVVAVTAPKMKLKKQLDVGEKYLTDMDYDNAILAYQTAIQMNPKAEEGYLGLANVYNTMAGNLESQGDPKEALEYLEKAVDVLKDGEDKTGSGNVKTERERLESRKAELEISVREQEFYKACHELLVAYRQDIGYTRPYGNDSNPLKTVAFCDIFGDKVPEMVYSTKTENIEYGYELYKLHIVTLLDGKLEELIEPMGFDEPVAGSTNYVLFKKDSENKLYGRCEYGDDWWCVEFLDFVPGTDGKSLERKIEYIRESEPDYENRNGYQDIVTCKKGETQISEGEYNDATNEILQKCNQIVFRSAMYTADYYTDQKGLFSGKTDISMTCDEAIAFLEDWINNNYKLKETDEGSYDIFSKLPEEFYFSSGAGAWGTSLVINPDGTFQADYHDSNMGESGPGYDSTTYMSSCKGKFSKAVKINEYTYRVTLEEITYEEEIGKETYDTYEGITTRYVYTDCYGLEGGKTFYIYLKGAPVEELPIAFVNWVKMPMALKKETELPFTGFYNAEMQEGFASWEY